MTGRDFALSLGAFLLPARQASLGSRGGITGYLLKSPVPVIYGIVEPIREDLIGTSVPLSRPEMAEATSESVLVLVHHALHTPTKARG